MVALARIARTLLALAAMLACGTTAAAERADLVIGYRHDVPPFSEVVAPGFGARMTADAPVDQNDPTGNVITGYMISICASVLEEMRKREDFSVDYFQIEDASDRFELLKEGNIDLLCDPATINRARLAEPTVMVSPPVYLSGVGVAEYAGALWAYHWPCTGPLVGIVKGTTAARAVQGIAKEGGFGPTFSEVVAQHPFGTDPRLTDDDKRDIGNCTARAASDGIEEDRLSQDFQTNAFVVSAFPNHEALATALCAGEIYYSVGDLEIIARALQAVGKKDQAGCQAEINPQVFSEERYGVFVHIANDPEADAATARRNRLVLAFLRELSVEIHRGEDSLLVHSFADNFERRKISRSLDLFFWSLVAGAN